MKLYIKRIAGTVYAMQKKGCQVVGVYQGQSIREILQSIREAKP